MSPKKKWEIIAQKLTRKNKDVSSGKMMSAPGLKFKDKTFLYYWKEELGCKLGKNYDIEAHNLSSWSHLNPFKSKPPLTAWYIITKEDLHQWEIAASEALKFVEKEK